MLAPLGCAAPQPSQPNPRCGVANGSSACPFGHVGALGASLAAFRAQLSGTAWVGAAAAAAAAVAAAAAGAAAEAAAAAAAAAGAAVAAAGAVPAELPAAAAPTLPPEATAATPPPPPPSPPFKHSAITSGLSYGRSQFQGCLCWVQGWTLDASMGSPDSPAGQDYRILGLFGLPQCTQGAPRRRLSDYGAGLFPDCQKAAKAGLTQIRESVGAFNPGWVVSLKERRGGAPESASVVRCVHVTGICMFSSVWGEVMDDPMDDSRNALWNLIL